MLSYRRHPTTEKRSVRRQKELNELLSHLTRTLKNTNDFWFKTSYSLGTIDSMVEYRSEKDNLSF